MENTNSPQANAEQGKTIAIISYITLIGWIVALVMHGSNKTSIGGYHLRQSLGLMLLAISTIVIRIPLMFIPFIGWGANLLISIALLIFWIIGLVSAINAEEKPLPIMGEAFQKWFASIGT